MDLTDLKNRIDAARAVMEAPLEPGEWCPIMPVTVYLAEEDWKEAWKVVRLIRERRRLRIARRCAWGPGYFSRPGREVAGGLWVLFFTFAEGGPGHSASVSEAYP